MVLPTSRILSGFLRLLPEKRHLPLKRSTLPSVSIILSHLFNFRKQMLPNFASYYLNKNKMSNKILVIGSTGKTGSRVFNRLQSKNVDVRPGSRSSKIPFDWYDDTTWVNALEGISKVCLTFYPDIAMRTSEGIIYNF